MPLWWSLQILHIHLNQRKHSRRAEGSDEPQCELLNSDPDSMNTKIQRTVLLGCSPEEEEGRTMIFHMRVFVHLSVTSQAEFKSCEWLVTISTVPAFVSCFSTNLRSRLAVPRFLFDGPTVSLSSCRSAQPHIAVSWAVIFSLLLNFTTVLIFNKSH